MGKRKLSVLFVVLVTVIMAFTSFMGEFAKPAAAQVETLKIGFLSDISSPLGRDCQRLLEALVDVVNEKNGLVIGSDRYKIELIVYDSKSSAETGRAAIEKLIYHDKVKFILGDPTADAWLPITEENKVVSVVFSPSPACVKPSLKYTFQGSFLNTAVTVAWGWFSTNYPELKTIGALLPDDLNGHNDAKLLEKICDVFGLKKVSIVFYPHGTTDFGAYATKMKSLNPQIYTTAGSGPPWDALSLKFLREAGYEGLFFNYRGLSPEKWAKIVNLNVLKRSIYVIGDIDLESPLSAVSKEAKAIYIAKYGSWDYPAVPFVGNWYLLKTALENAQSIDPGKVAAVIGNGLKFDTPFAPAMMISRPDLGKTRTIDALYGTHVATYEGGKTKLIHKISVEEAFGYIKKSRIFGAYPD